jgi:hypothetical protein
LINVCIYIYIYILWIVAHFFQPIETLYAGLL